MSPILCRYPKWGDPTANASKPWPIRDKNGMLAWTPEPQVCNSDAPMLLTCVQTSPTAAHHSDGFSILLPPLVTLVVLGMIVITIELPSFALLQRIIGTYEDQMIYATTFLSGKHTFCFASRFSPTVSRTGWGCPRSFTHASSARQTATSPTPISLRPWFAKARVAKESASRSIQRCFLT